MVRATGFTVSVAAMQLIVLTVVPASAVVMLYGLPLTWLLAVAVVVSVGCVVRLAEVSPLTRPVGVWVRVRRSELQSLYWLVSVMVSANGSTVSVPAT